jgi:hypothetical protein
MNRLFKQTFFLLIVIGILNWIGTELYLYWTVWWYDMLLHFLSGFSVGLAAVWLWGKLFSVQMHFWKTIVFALFGSLIIGVLWEAYELYFGITLFSDGISYVTDTLSDLTLDICGGFFSGLYAFRLLNSNPK